MLGREGGRGKGGRLDEKPSWKQRQTRLAQPAKQSPPNINAFSKEVDKDTRLVGKKCFRVGKLKEDTKIYSLGIAIHK